MTAALDLPVGEGAALDADKQVVRLPIASMRALGRRSGDIAKVEGPEGVAFVRMLPASGDDVPTARLDGRVRAVCGLQPGVQARLSPAEAAAADRVVLAVARDADAKLLGLKKLLRQQLEDLPVTPGQSVTVRLLGGRALTAQIVSASPEAADRALICGPETRIDLQSGADARLASITAYEDLGGLSRELGLVREMVELPIRRADLFARLGIDPPRGVLMSGPPGTGKTLLARAVAEECGLTFFQINGPEIATKHFGESEKQLRDVFEKAAKQAPSLVFIDELDAIAPKRDTLNGDRQVERRVVAQLLTLMDGLSGRGQVVVIAATNLPDAIDGALRRPGRFDREIAFGPPDTAGRGEILAVHTRGMPLAPDVSLDGLSATTHGYVGADLAALAREAGMAALRRHAVPPGGGPVDVGEIVVTDADFAEARRGIVPTALREVYTERPATRWSDVRGQDEAVETLREALEWPVLHADLLAGSGIELPRGILLAGPPGTGKTLLARAAAGETGMNLIALRGPELLSQFFGEAERAVRETFRKARMAAPCLVFLDEIDAIAPRRGGDTGVMDRIVAQLLVELDRAREEEGVFVLAATNRPGAMDPALLRPGRFDLTVEVGHPEPDGRAAILARHLAGMPLADDADLAALAARADGFSGADLASACRRAGAIALRRSIETRSASGDAPSPRITQGDLGAALDATRRAKATTTSDYVADGATP